MKKRYILPLSLLLYSSAQVVQAQNLYYFKGENGKYGYRSESGVIILPPIYDSANQNMISEPFDSDGKEELLQSVYSKVVRIIVDIWGVEESAVIPKASFTNHLGADSLDVVELIMVLEKKFNLLIPDREAEKIETVEQAVIYIGYKSSVLQNEPATVLKEGAWGYVDRLGTFSTSKQELIDKLKDFNYFYKLYASPKVEIWQHKDEFETIDEYKTRVNDKNREELLAQLQTKAEREFISIAKKNVVNDLQLSDYDADNQSFLYRSPTHGDFAIHVPRDVARDYKQRSRIDLQGSKYGIMNGRIALLQLATSYDHKLYASADVNYIHTNVNLNFTPITYENITATYDRPTALVEAQTISVGNSITSDIDQDIPMTKASNNTFVLIIVNADYQKESAITTAKRDAVSTKNYCTKTLGIPESNISYNENCTWKNMERAVESFAYTMRLNPDAKFLMFYFGHGMANPNVKVEDSYLLPVDGSSIYITQDGYSRNRMITELAQASPKQCVIFLESCFSGATPTNEMLTYSKNTSGVRIAAKNAIVNGNIVLFSASSDAQTANAYPEQGHNLFTYKLLKTLKECGGTIALGELFDKVQLETIKTANNILEAKQTPTYIASPLVVNSWRNWTLY